MGCSDCCRKSETKAESEDSVVDFHGPLAHRECRDILFLIIFIAFIVGMGVVAYFGIKNGNPYRLIYGADSWGNVCNQPNEAIPNVSKELTGIDMTGKEKLFYLDPKFFMSLIPDANLPSFSDDDFVHICIEKCPNTTEVLDLYNEEGISLCRYDVTPYVNDIEKCPNTPVQKHVSLFNRCIPESVYLMAKALASSFTSVLGKSVLGKGYTQKMVSDLRNTWKEILYLAAISVGKLEYEDPFPMPKRVALCVVAMMRFLAAIIVWTLVFGVVILSVGATSYCWYSWYSLSDEFQSLPENRQTDEAAEYVRTWLIYSIIASCITLIILLILLVLRKRIALVVQLYVEAGQAIGDVPLLLLMPLWTLLVLIACLFGLLVISVYIETSGLPQVNQDTGFVTYEMEGYWNYVRWYHIFGILWISSFIIACQDLIIAGAVAKWFFTRDKKNLGWPILLAFKRLIRYHLGSVAFGSFIIAVVKLARLILAYIQKRLKGKAGKITDFILKMLQCCLWCFERFLKYLNRNAYIEIAIYGYNFCTSAKKAFLLIVSNALRVAAINSIGDFVLFLGKVSTVAIVVVIGRELLRHHDDINYIWFPITLAAAFSFAIAHCFLLVYEKFLDDTEKAEAKSQMKNSPKNKETTKV